MNYLNEKLWNYATTEGLLSKLDGYGRSNTRPPVFQKQHAILNILLAPDAVETHAAVVGAVTGRHSKFCSMKSSQALTQSVFANLIVSNNLHALNDLATDQGFPAFGIDLNDAEVHLEYSVKNLRETKPTSVDVFIRGAHRIAVECKLTEQDFGKCSSIKSGSCDGNYARQLGRKQRCYLSEKGIAYWQYAPKLFRWQNNRDISPCPLNATYQIARNLLAACVVAEGIVDTDSCHVLIIYDKRNPAFGRGGKCRLCFDAAYSALKNPSLLRSCTWQSVVDLLSRNTSTQWLAAQLKSKYGF